ncbi:MAG: class B sortase [Clostridia bacterium]|nr:class B sortase [Clostridia bacterium]
MKRLFTGLIAAAMLFSLGCTPAGAEQNPDEMMVTVIENTPLVEIESTPNPEAVAPEETGYVFPRADKMNQARNQNSDVVGWIYIPGTNIDYPILYGEKWYYADRDINMEKNSIGSVYSHLNMASYEEYGVSQNLVVAAQNARVSGTLFHQLHHIQEVNLGQTNCAYRKCGMKLDPAVLPDLTTPEGRTWDISICGIDARWEVWSMYEGGPNMKEELEYYNTWFILHDRHIPKTEQDVQEWIDDQLERSQIDFGVEVSTSDQFLTLYTSGDNKDSDETHLFFFLKQVEPVSVKFKGGLISGIQSEG